MIMQKKKKKLCSGLVLFDLAKAFDTIDLYVLLQKLNHYGLRGIADDFFKIIFKKQISICEY